MTFSDIFAEYYTLFRGQAEVPDSLDEEWTIAMRLANNAIRKWDRADGTLWNELYTSAEAQESGLVMDGERVLDLPSDIRKPGGIIRFGNGKSIQCLNPQDSIRASDNVLGAFFTGSANTSWQLNFTGNIVPYDGQTVDFVYYKKPTLMTDANSVPEMSDVNFMIQDMLASRASNERNGFVTQTARADATTALQNMIIENMSGGVGNEFNILNTDSSPGFGQNNRTSFFRS